MNSQAYSELSDFDLLTLVIWREARGEGMLGKRGVAHVVDNRASAPCWWGHDIPSVILHPYQFSSFNPSDPNADKWPDEDEPSLADCQEAARGILQRTDPDLTSGATYYWSPPLVSPPKQWGSVVETLHTGNLHFCKSLAPLVVTDVELGL